jgi:DNA-binding NarL/FixJ family response regulator
MERSLRKSKGTRIGMNAQKTPIQVILADDHAIVRAGIRQFLEFSEDIHVVAETDDGEKALALAETLKPDVVVLDIQMPKLSGIEVARMIRAKSLPVGILILTAYDDDAYVSAVLKAGANGYVLKTASPAEIIAAIRDVHQGKSVLDALIVSKVMALVSGQAAVPPEFSITDREMDILLLAGKGMTNKAIGTQLNISDRTVQGHLAKIFEKLQVTSRTEAVMRAVSLGWLTAEPVS